MPAPAMISRTMPRAQPRRRPAGFTMVEILTATAIMVIVISVVMTIVTQVMNAWNQSADRLILSGDARSLLDAISRDLQTAIFKRDGSQWLYLDPNDPATGSKITGTQFTRLIFFSPTADRQTRTDGSQGTPGKQIFGDICAIEYRVLYDDPFGIASSTQKTFTLHRVTIDPASTYYGIRGQSVMGLKGQTNTLARYFDQYVDIGQSAVTNTPPIGPNGSPLQVSVYGALTPDSGRLYNVAQFSVVLSAYAFSSSTTPNLQLYTMYELWGRQPTQSMKFYFGGGPSSRTAGSTITSTEGYFDTLIGTGSPPRTFAGFAYADITLTLLTDEGIQILQSQDGNVPQGFTWSQFLAQHSETYTARVPIMNKPL